MVDIIHRIGIKAPVADVYQAIASTEGVAGWWSRETSGDAGKGGTITVVFRSQDVEIGRMAMEVATDRPSERVRWRVTAGPPEWIDTDITFDLKQEGEHTILIFGHRKWREAVEFTAHCSMKWATFLLSLRDLVEKGAGRPSPEDLKIDNWN